LAYIKRALDYPIFTEPEDALAALAISREHYRKLNISKEKPLVFSANRDRVKSIFDAAKKEGRDPLLPEAFEVLQAYGIPVADYRMVRRKEEMKKAMDDLGTPVAIKVVSKMISHKSDVGGVILQVENVKKAEETCERIEKMARESFEGVLVQKMISGGKEVIFGGKRDPSFGPAILFGLGGIYVEILKETSLRVAPINRSEVEEMISELKSSVLLKGVRGEKPSDIEAAVESLLRFSQLMTDFPEIEGIDINPVMVLEKGVMAVDARILLSK
jgi:acyl-CoA synthetase (NDP forming)